MVVEGFGQQDTKERFALVIGIKSYNYVAPLQNTVNDANDMARALQAKGFHVIKLIDPRTKRELQDGVVKYFKLLESNPRSAGLIFYSGHGMQVDGSNYLIPSDANPKIKADLEDQCLNMDYVMRAIEQAGNPLNIFILDACRNNPFKGFYRSAEQGLNMVATPKGSYIVYATKPGSVASDGTSGNGLFTSKLLKYINSGNLNIEQVFKKVALEVSKESGDRQRPWIASDYTGDFYFETGISNATAVLPSTEKEDEELSKAEPKKSGTTDYQTMEVTGDLLFNMPELQKDVYCSDGIQEMSGYLSAIRLESIGAKGRIIGVYDTLQKNPLKHILYIISPDRYGSYASSDNVTRSTVFDSGQKVKIHVYSNDYVKKLENVAYDILFMDLSGNQFIQRVKPSGSDSYCTTHTLSKPKLLIK
jgi:hypothetical protein